MFCCIETWLVSIVKYSFTLNIIPVKMCFSSYSRNLIFQRTSQFTSSSVPPNCLWQIFAFYLKKTPTKQNTFLSARKLLKNVFRCISHRPDIEHSDANHYFLSSMLSIFLKQVAVSSKISIVFIFLKRC